MFDKDTLTAARNCVYGSCLDNGTECPYNGDIRPCTGRFAKAILDEVERDKSHQSKPEQNDSWQSALAQAAAEAVERFNAKQISTNQTEPTNTKPEQNSTEQTESNQPKPNEPRRIEPIEQSSVDHPAHYQGEYECIDLMREIYGDEAVRNFCIINAYKYRFRAGKKQGETAQSDLDKADWYERYVMNHMQRNYRLQLELDDRAKLICRDPYSGTERVIYGKRDE